MTKEEALLSIDKGCKALGWVTGMPNQGDISYMIIGEKEAVVEIMEMLDDSNY